MSKEIIESENQLIHDVIKYIEQSRQQLAVTVNTAMSDLYWSIGNRIKTDLLGNEKA